MSRITVRWNGLDGLINDKPFLPSCSPEQQAEVLMELAEQDGERLGSSERRLILEYARAVRDYRKVRDLVDELSDASFELRHGHVDPMMEGLSRSRRLPGVPLVTVRVLSPCSQLL